ncbi:hypothetical protein R1flu_019263 [Riccia fluitans]|uniref:Tify domain-containing protein n=1 Tax=Riccia fluitans TaxID=41844 RepID=A0ABD1ZI65_9MARC
MAEKEEQYGSDSAMSTNPDHAWTQQPAMPLWCLKKESVPLSGSGRLREEAGEDSSRKASVVIDDNEDESGLELSLGLSLGGPVSKPKARNGQKDGGTGVEERESGEKMNDDISSRKLMRRDGDASISRTQAFWQEFDISREGSQHDQKLPGTLASDVLVRERHPTSMSSLSSSITPSSSLGLSDTWRTIDNSCAGEESKAAVTFPFWKQVPEKPLLPEQGNGKDEVPMFQALPGPSSQTAAWTVYGQSALAMSLLERFKDTKDENPHVPFPVSSQECKTPMSATSSDTVEGGQLQLSKEGGDVVSPDDGLLTSDPRFAQETIEQLRKQKKQEARKRRKAFMEEQKIQKKAKEEDEGRFASGLVPKPMGSRPGTPPGTKSSPAFQQQANSREASSPSNSQDVGSGGLQRTSSGLWSRASGTRDVQAAGSPEKTQEKGPTEKCSEDDNPVIENRKASQGDRNRSENEKARDVGVDKEGNSRQEPEHRSPGKDGLGKIFTGEETADASCGPRENAAAPSAALSIGPDVNKVQADATWVQRMLESQMNTHSAYQMAAALMENKEQLLKGLPDLNGRKGKSSENAPAVDKDRLKAFVPPALDRNERNNERNRVEPIVGDAKKEDGNRPTAVGLHATPGSVMAYSQQSTFPLIHRPYPFPVPVADPTGLPYPMPYPFPYMMQYAHVDSSSGQERPGVLTLPSPFPTVSSHLPYPVVGDVSTLGWAPVLRPQTTPPHSPPRTLVRSASEMAIEENRNLQGAKSGENVRNVSPTKDASKAGHTLIRASSSGSIQGQSGAFARLRSSPSLPPTPQFGPVRSRADMGDPITYRDGYNVVGNSAFASLVAAVEASQGLSAAVASMNTTTKQPATTRTGGSKLERTSSRTLPDSLDDMTGGSNSSSKVSSQQQEGGDAQHGDSVSSKSSSVDEPKVTHGSKVQQGTTTLPEGLIRQMGQEGSCLKSGCDAELKFGGSGSSPDLPWVTCKGAGPNGKAISGVLYKYNKGQVRIVCACHGRHMSPSEFVQHAGNEDLSNPEKNIVVNAFPHGGQAAAAQR